MCDPNAPGGSYCVQHNQGAFTVLVIAGAAIFVALVIVMCIKFGVKRTFAILTTGLRPRRQHHHDVVPDGGADFEEAGVAVPETGVVPDRQQQKERRLSAETGIAQWQVRVDLHDHHETVALAQRLSAEGHSISKGRKFVVAGADCEDDAYRLAETIRMYNTADAKIHVGPWIPAVSSPEGAWFTTPPAFRETGDEEEIIDAPTSAEPCTDQDNADRKDKHRR